MATMPPRSPSGQPRLPSPVETLSWFDLPPGRAVLDSEQGVVEQAIAERPGQPWLWLAPGAPDELPPGRGLALGRTPAGWTGAITCGLPLPLPTECFGCVVLQHVAGATAPGLLDEAARILVPGGRLWLLALNPVAPYRWRWSGQGLAASEPLTWRRRLRKVGLQPDPVSQGLGPTWQVQTAPQRQEGPGLRAAYLVRSEKRAHPLTPVRQRQPLRLRLPGELAAG